MSLWGWHEAWASPIGWPVVRCSGAVRGCARVDFLGLLRLRVANAYGSASARTSASASARRMFHLDLARGSPSKTFCLCCQMVWEEHSRRVVLICWRHGARVRRAVHGLFAGNVYLELKTNGSRSLGRMVKRIGGCAALWCNAIGLA